MSEEKLRSRDECEKQLAAELAVGAVDSIDSLISRGHETACEYGCQLLFEGVRKKVAERTNLPIRIARHLANDRCGEVRLAIYKSNWASLTPEQQEAFVQGVEQKRALNWQESGILTTITKLAIANGEEQNAIRYISIIHADNSWSGLRNLFGTCSLEEIQVLSKLPKLLDFLWKTAPRSIDPRLILINTDEAVRMEELQKVLRETPGELKSRWWTAVRNHRIRRESIKITILKLFANDPSAKIRKTIVEKCTNPGVLSLFVDDSDPTIAKLATTFKTKYEKRAAYSKAYHLKKQQELEAKRGW